jgi:hypothetical protein
MLTHVETVDISTEKAPIYTARFTDRPTPETKLSSRWIRVDGKLICQWYKTD